MGEDAPFEIPAGWAWCRLGEIAEVQLGKMLDRKKTNGTPLPYLANVSVRWREFDLLALKMMPFSESEKEKFALRPGDIIMCEGGVPGRCAIWREPDSQIKYQKALHRIRLRTVPAEYICYFFEAIHDTMFFTNRFSGSTIHHLPREVLIQMPIPLPPLAEQRRIVTRIEELFKIADSLGEAADGLEAAAKRLDKKILDLAIRGKLVPQDPSDEPASELLKRIAATSHKSPCKNQDAPIEPPFEIPESWVWIKLGSLVNIISGVSYTKDAMRETGIRILRGGNLDENAELSLHDDDVFVSADYYDMNNEVHSGDIVIVASTGSSQVMGRPAIARSDLPGVQIGAFLRIVRSNYAETAKWIAVIFCGSYYRTHIQKMSKGTNIKNLKAAYISELQIPLPPLEEQKRIVPCL